MKTVYLGLGSNVGDREAMLQAAIDRLHAADLRITRLSSVYETEPMDVADQRWFLNMVVEARTELFPLQLLARTSKVEAMLGRRRRIPKGPRAIDIDILFHGSSAVNTSVLVIPHPRFSARRFVLAPLAELVPGLRDPVSRRTVEELLREIAGQCVRRVDFRPEIPSGYHGVESA